MSQPQQLLPSLRWGIKGLHRFATRRTRSATKRMQRASKFFCTRIQSDFWRGAVAESIRRRHRNPLPHGDHSDSRVPPIIPRIAARDRASACPSFFLTHSRTLCAGRRALPHFVTPRTVRGPINSPAVRFTGFAVRSDANLRGSRALALVSTVTSRRVQRHLIQREEGYAPEVHFSHGRIANVLVNGTDSSEIT
jgi:hypothetical protein